MTLNRLLPDVHIVSTVTLSSVSGRVTVLNLDIK